MLIIIEGPDGVGKSTLVAALCQRIVERTNGGTVRIKHCGPPKEHPLLEYGLPLWPYRGRGSNYVVCDRWHLGELVYPQVLERPTQLDAASLIHIELTLRARGAVLVHLTQPHDVLEHRLRDRGDDLVKIEHLEQILNGYAAACDRTQLRPVLHIQGRDPTVHDVDTIITLAGRRAEEVEPLRTFTTYVGPPRPRLLLLGDTRGNLPPGWVDAPAFVPMPATSGHYLLTALQTELRRNRVGLANACDVDNIKVLYRALGRPAVVTLGKKAEAAVYEVLGRRPSVPHPQYWRRFRHSESKLYADMIMGRRKEET